MWAYHVSGKQVLWQWFSYRRRDRSRPIIGDRHPPSPLDNIQLEGGLAEYTTDLLDLLHVLGRLFMLEPAQAALLSRICAGPIGRLRATVWPPSTTMACPTRAGFIRAALFDEIDRDFDRSGRNVGAIMPVNPYNWLR